MDYHGFESGGKINLVRERSYFLIFQKYKLNVASFSASVETNHKNSKIYVDGKYIKTAADEGTGDYVAKIGPYLAGEHDIQIKASASNHNLSTSGTISLWKNNQTYDGNIKTANLAIFGPKGGQVYVGNKYVGEFNNNGILDLEYYQYNSETTAYVVYKVKNNKFTSKEANISEAVENTNNSSDSDSDFNGEVQQARDKTNDYDSSYVNVYPDFKAAPSMDTVSSLIKDCFKDPDSDEFIGGSDNKYYKSFRKMADNFNDSDKIMDWSVEPDVNNVYPIGDGVFECNTKLDYKFEHENDDHIQVAHYPHITFKKENGDFKILSMGDGKIIYDVTKK